MIDIKLFRVDTVNFTPIDKKQHYIIWKPLGIYQSIYISKNKLIPNKNRLFI